VNLESCLFGWGLEPTLNALLHTWNRSFASRVCLGVPNGRRRACSRTTGDSPLRIGTHGVTLSAVTLAAAAVETATSGEPVRSENPRTSMRLLVRIGSHSAIWTAVLVPVLLELSRGWRALQDDATISIRTFETFSFNPPLLGQFSTSSIGSGHLLFDPGPLQYWLLAIPVRIDPSQGVLWGGALVIGLVLSLGVEALWRSDHVVACGVLGLAILDLAWAIPSVFNRPMWNPNFSIPFLITSIVLAWLVSMGSLQWWPWLVFTASVVVQSEVFFAFFAVALIVVPLCLGIVRRRPDRLGWLKWGLAVGFLCWFPTVLQEVGDRQPNLTLLLEAHRGGPPVGIAFGLRSLGFAASTRPIWTLPSTHLAFLVFDLLSQTPLDGLLTLAVLIAIAVWASMAGRESLGALATIVALSALCLVVTFGVVPKPIVYTLLYLGYVLWIVGTLVWITVGWGVYELAMSAHRAWTRSSTSSTDGFSGLTPSRPAKFGAAAVLVVCAVAVGFVGLRSSVTSSSKYVSSHDNALASRITTLIERRTTRGPVSITFAGHPKETSPLFGIDYVPAFAVGLGVAWQLTTDGWQPALPALFTSRTGLTYPRSSTHWPAVTVTINGSEVTVTHVTTPTRTAEA
jgi:hypothetical protein